MERKPLKVAMAVCNIINAIAGLDSTRLASKMSNTFGWWTFAEEHPDMTAEEIASAAADGFDLREGN